MRLRRDWRVAGGEGNPGDNILSDPQRGYGFPLRWRIQEF